MSDSRGDYTYICSAGSRKSILLYFTDGTPRQHRKDPHCRPDMVSTVKRPGTDQSLQSNFVEGALFSEYCRQHRSLREGALPQSLML